MQPKEISHHIPMGIPNDLSSASDNIAIDPEKNPIAQHTVNTDNSCNRNRDSASGSANAFIAAIKKPTQPMSDDWRRHLLLNSKCFGEAMLAQQSSNSIKNRHELRGRSVMKSGGLTRI